MFTRMMKHDWMDLRAGRTVWLMMSAIALLAGYAVASGISFRSAQEASHKQAIAKETRDLGDLRAEAAAYHNLPEDQRPEKLPNGVKPTYRNQIFHYATLPPAPLSSLAVGQSDVYPNSYRVDSGGSNRYLTKSELRSPTSLLAGRFDLAYFVVFLMPLFLLALSYDLLSREREQGTLALVLAQPVRLWQLVAAKAVLRCGLVLGVTLSIIAAGFLISGDGLASGDAWTRLLLFCAVVALYAVFWCAVAVFVNARGQSSASNALALAGVWLVLAVVVPSLSSIAITTVHPPPSRFELVTALNDAKNEAHNKGEKVLDDFFVHHPEMAPMGAAATSTTDAAVRSIATAETAELAIQPLLRAHAERLADQQILGRRMAYLSPVMIAQSALNSVAGTSFSRFDHFIAQVRSFHEAWKHLLHGKTLRNELLTPADYDSFPKFSFQPEPLAPVLSFAIAASAYLAALATLLVFMGFSKLSKPAT